MTTWSYADTISDSRKQALTNPPTFESIVQSINRDMTILCGHRDCLQNHHEDGYYRAIYCIEVSEPLFDLFSTLKMDTEHGIFGPQGTD